MDHNGNKFINLIYSDDNKENKILLLDENEDIDKYFSKTDYLRNKNSSIEENKNQSSIEPIEIKENKEQSKNKKHIFNSKNDKKNLELINNNFNLKIYHAKTSKDYNALRLNDAINSVNLNLDYSVNTKIESIKINRKHKKIINSTTENNSIVSNKHINKIKPYLRKNQQSIDNSFINRKIHIFSDRNKPQLKMIPNNTDINKNINLNIYNSIKTKKRIVSSLKIKSKVKAKAPKLNQNISFTKKSKFKS